MKFILLSEEDLEQVYAEQYPDMIEFVPFDGDDDYNEVCLIEFKDEKAFMTFCADMFEKGNRIRLSPHRNNGMGGEYEEVTDGAPFMVIEDHYSIVDTTAWEELIRAYNGE